jgi:hypothetical protein
MKKKTVADGFCGICDEKVPKTNLNKFYCSEPCRIEAWKFYHPEEQEPDWDSIPKVLYF